MRKRTHGRRGLIAFAAASAVFAATLTAWAVAGQATSIPVTPGSAFSYGALAHVTSLGGSNDQFTVQTGHAQRIGGLELYQINLGNASFSNAIVIHTGLLNEPSVEKVLHRAYVDLSVWYPGTGSGSQTLSDGTSVVPDPGPDATGRLSEVTGDVLLKPSVTNQSTLYILASIVTAGGGVPPGQQDNISNMQFFIDVRRP